MPTATPNARSASDDTLRAHEKQLANLQAQVRKSQERLSAVVGVLSKSAQNALKKADKKSGPKTGKKQTSKKSSAKKASAKKGAVRKAKTKKT